MPTFDLKHCRIYHPPKTGGNWVWLACEHAGLLPVYVSPKHIGPQDAPPAPPKIGVSIVRHPLSWWRSVYQNRVEHWTSGKNGADLAGNKLVYYPGINECRADTYAEFMRNILSANRVGYWHGPYRHPCISYILKQESLATDLVRVLQLAGEVFDPAAIYECPHVNVRDYGDHREHDNKFFLPRGLRGAVMGAVDPDHLELFGY